MMINKGASSNRVLRDARTDVGTWGSVSGVGGWKGDDNDVDLD